MSAQLIGQMVGSGIGAYGSYKSAEANKPFLQRAFKRKAQTGYLRKYLSDLQGRSANRARTELAMRPALRAIGAQQRMGQRQLAYGSAQQGLEGSGIEAQKQLALQAGTTQAVGSLSEKVLMQQLTQARQTQAQREGQRMKLHGEIGRQEGAVGEANRMAEFQVSQANRKAQHDYDVQLEQAKIAAITQMGQSMVGGGTEMIGQEQQVAALAGIPMAEGGLVTNDGIAKYTNGGVVEEDITSILPGYEAGVTKFKEKATERHEKEKKRYTEDVEAFELKKSEKEEKHEGEKTKLQSKLDVLEKYDVGEKDFIKAQKDYQKWMKRSHEFIRDKFQDSAIEDESLEGDPKASKFTPPWDMEQYSKKTTDQDVETYADFDDFLKKKKSQGKYSLPDKTKKRLTKKYKGKLEDLGEFEPGEAPEEPILEEMTEKQKLKLRKKEIRKLLSAGYTAEDIRKQITGATKAREEKDFADLLLSENLDTKTLMETEYAKDNPIKVANIINKRRQDESGQYADYMKSVTTTNIVNAIRSGNPNEISDVYNSPEYQYMLINASDKALSIFKTGNTEIDKIAKTQATDQAKADKWIGHRDDLRYTLWGMDKILMKDKVPQPGQPTMGAGRILQIINDPYNAEGITQAHLTEIEGILAEMKGEGAEKILGDKGSASGLIGEGGGLSDDDFWGTYIKDAKFEKILKGLNNFVRAESTQKPFAWK